MGWVGIVLIRIGKVVVIVIRFKGARAASGWRSGVKFQPGFLEDLPIRFGMWQTGPSLASTVIRERRVLYER
jgi:hypothetical protein